MSDVTVKMDFVELEAKLSALAREQIPFATSLALNNVARIAQAQLKSELSKHFTIRSNWVERGIQFKAAKKQDWPAAQVEIGSKDKFMLLQETGGIKTSLSGKNLATPIDIRKEKTDMTPRSKWPGKLLTQRKQKQGYFVGPVPETGRRQGALAVMKRTDLHNFEIMYILKSTVKIKKRWDLRAAVPAIFESHFETEFGRALAKAIATAK